MNYTSSSAANCASSTSHHTSGNHVVPLKSWILSSGTSHIFRHEHQRSKAEPWKIVNKAAVSWT